MSDVIDIGKSNTKNERRMHANTGCDTCKFCGVISTVDKTIQLVCRAHPPSLTMQFIPTPQGPQPISATGWPGVSNSDWCGEHSPKLAS